MYSTIHAADSESYFRLQNKQTAKVANYSEWSVFNQTAFSDVGHVHESFEIRFEFNSQSSSIKNFSNFDENGYFNSGSDLNSCWNQFE